LWEHRGKVAAVGVGHSPTARRWDGTPETCVGAWSILALRRAIADAGVSPDQIDGLVLDPVTTTGAYWPAGTPVPLDVVNAFQPTSDPLEDCQAERGVDCTKHAGADQYQFVMYAPVYVPRHRGGRPGVGAGLTHTCLVLRVGIAKAATRVGRTRRTPSTARVRSVGSGARRHPMARPCNLPSIAASTARPTT
jgi:hypothetical protein